MTATKGFITGAATTALDTRKADAEKVVQSGAGVPRAGVLTTNPSIVTADASTSPMRVAVAKAGFVTARDAADGVAMWTNDGSIFVTIAAAPLSNSRIDVVYAKHNDTTKGDANNDPVIAVAQGTAAASPAKPAIPSGALELATVLVPAGATATTSGSVVITNTYPMTAMRGGVVPFRTTTERDAFVASDGQLGRIGSTFHTYDTSAWRSIFNESASATPTPGTGWDTPSQNSLVRVGGAVFFKFNAFRSSGQALGVGGIIASIPAGFRTNQPVWDHAWGLSGAAAAIQVYYDQNTNTVKANQGIAAAQSLAVDLSWPQVG